MRVNPPDPGAALPPEYGAASLADVLPSAFAALGLPGQADPLGLRERLDGVRRIVVLLVDGLGYHLLPAAAPVAPTIRELLAGRLGTVAKLTSGFPSTTPTSLVTLGTGVPPGTHGVLGFTLNIPGTVQVLNHIEWRNDPLPATWQPVPTMFERADHAGISVTAVSRPEFAGSGLTVSAYRGARYVGASTIEAQVGAVLTALSPTPSLVYAYHPTLDSTGHLHGLTSDQWLAAAAEVDVLLAGLVAGLPHDAALLVTADHGQLDIPAEHRYDIDVDPRLSAGVGVVAGEPRVRYLHTLPGAASDVLAAWREVLGDAAWVISREEATATGWYGTVPAEHAARLGDVVVLCRNSYAVMATAREPAMVSKLVAYHGSYTEVEMAIPLILIRGAH
jgi:hypothetical protein